jgi:hypothetical protein
VALDPNIVAGKKLELRGQEAKRLEVARFLSGLDVFEVRGVRLEDDARNADSIA